MCTADFALNSVIRGHHVYKTVWSPFVGKILHLQTDARNVHDTHTVAIVVMVGHAPREMFFLYFWQHGGSTSAEAIGHRKYGHGLEGALPLYSHREVQTH